MTPDRIDTAVRPHGLFVMGHDATRVLIGTDANWWQVFVNTSEYGDGSPDPVDRWSKRILGGVAQQMGARACFPSDGPPYAPFIAWALATGRFWQSPTGMIIHDKAGLMISIRGALEFVTPFAAAPSVTSPCVSCADKPCISCCPVDALADDRLYDVPACKAYLDTAEGRATCMSQGCAVRRACPVSQTFARPNAQSAFHMKAFVG